MKSGHYLALLAAAGIVGALMLVMGQQSASAHFNAPPEQPNADDDLSRLQDHSPDGHPSVLCQPQDHYAGYTYTPHRFPRTCGGEITALIHKGYGTMRVPNVEDVQWLIAPPSEVMF